MLIHGRSGWTLATLMGGLTLAITGVAMIGISAASDNQTSTVRRVSCPDVAGRLPDVPSQAQAEVSRNLTELQTDIAATNDRLTATDGASDPNFVQNAILGPLASQRTAIIDRIALAIGRSAPRPALDVAALSTCVVTTGNAAPAPVRTDAARSTRAPASRTAAARRTAALSSPATTGAARAAEALPPVAKPAATRPPTAPPVATRQTTPDLASTNNKIDDRGLAAAVALGIVVATAGWLRPRLRPSRSPQPTVSRNSRVLIAVGAVMAVAAAVTPPPWATLLALMAAGLAVVVVCYPAHFLTFFPLAFMSGGTTRGGYSRRHRYTFASLEQLSAALGYADPTRLRRRTHPGLTRAIQATSLVLQLAVAHNRAKALARDAGSCLASAADLTADLDRATGLAEALDRGLSIDLESSRDLARSIARPVGSRIERRVDLTLANDLAGDLGHNLDTAIGLVRDLGYGLDLVHLARERTRDLALDLAALQQQRDDFTRADLSTADLSGVDLDGVVWSRGGTRWPHGWMARVVEESVEEPPGTGVFEIRTTSLHTDAVLPAHSPGTDFPADNVARRVTAQAGARISRPGCRESAVRTGPASCRRRR